MKAQLLEDIGDSHPRAPLPPGQARPQPPEQSLQSTPEPQPPAQSPPPPSQEAAAQAAGAWVPPPGMSSPWTFDPPPPEAAPAWGMEDAAQPPSADQPDWFERWGRRAATGTAALLATLAVAGAGLWVYNENKIEKSLAVLAKTPIPAQHALPAPDARTLPAPAPALSAAPAAPASLAAQQAPSPGAPAAMADPRATDPRAADPRAADPRAAEPAPPLAARTTQAPAAGTQPERTERARKRTLASRTKTPPAAAAQAKYPSEKPERAGALTETLRQCRAAGYHAAKCVQLGCTATQYGLACKGGGGARG
jgi:hypothetical protein